MQPEWVIICTEDIKDETYVQPYKCHNITSIAAPEIKKSPYHYNLYCNELKKYVTKVHGHFFMFLDDDDFLVDNTAIERIAPILEQNKKSLVFVQMLRDTHRKPSDSLIDRRLFVSGTIGLPCIFVPGLFRGTAHISDKDNGDHEWMSKLKKKIPSIFVKQVFVNSPKRNYGKS